MLHAEMQEVDSGTEVVLLDRVHRVQSGDSALYLMDGP